MGEVYRARDTRLGRDVAIKVSHEQFSERFDREARAVAALNHPNICALYDVGPNYLVMELVEDDALQSPLPLAEALRTLPGKPRLWSEEQIYDTGTVHAALAPDGKRFAVFPRPDTAEEGNGSLHVTFLLNFFDELRRGVPAGK